MCRIPYDWRGDPENRLRDGRRRERKQHVVTAIDDPTCRCTTRRSTCGSSRRGPRQALGLGQRGPDGRARGLPCAPAAPLGDAIARTDRKVLLVASGALSHTFHKLRQLRDHEASDPGTSTPRGLCSGSDRIAWFGDGDHARVLDTMDAFMPYRPEAMFAHYLMLAGACGESDLRAAARQYGDYENSIGTGQVHFLVRRTGRRLPAAAPDARGPPDFVRQMGGPDLPAAG